MSDHRRIAPMSVHQHEHGHCMAGSADCADWCGAGLLTTGVAWIQQTGDHVDVLQVATTDGPPPVGVHVEVSEWMVLRMESEGTTERERLEVQAAAHVSDRRLQGNGGMSGMHKTIVAGLALGLGVLLAGCGGGGAADSAPSRSSASPATDDQPADFPTAAFAEIGDSPVADEVAAEFQAALSEMSDLLAGSECRPR